MCESWTLSTRLLLYNIHQSKSEFLSVQVLCIPHLVHVSLWLVIWKSTPLRHHAVYLSTACVWMNVNDHLPVYARIISSFTHIICCSRADTWIALWVWQFLILYTFAFLGLFLLLVWLFEPHIFLSSFSKFDLHKVHWIRQLTIGINIWIYLLAQHEYVQRKSFLRNVCKTKNDKAMEA